MSVARLALVLVLVVAVLMILFAAHIRLWWATGAGIAAVGLALAVFPLAERATSLEAWFFFEILVGPPLAVGAIGLLTFFATTMRRRLEQLPTGGPRPTLQPVADSLAPRSKRTSELGLAGYERRRSRASDLGIAQLRLSQSNP